MMRNFPKIFLRAWRAFEFSHGLRAAVFFCADHAAVHWSRLMLWTINGNSRQNLGTVEDWGGGEFGEVAVFGR